jgi:predicted enzyme related to lactoylglutathione lyase
MTDVVWWEIETRAPESFQDFYSALWGWTFEPAFADTGLGADYWLIRSGEPTLAGCSAPRLAAPRQALALASMRWLRTSKRRCGE